MKFHRIRIENFRGVVKREIEFDPTGVTVAEGPNEIGKSSFIPNTIVLHGLVYDLFSGGIEIVVNGY